MKIKQESSTTNVTLVAGDGTATVTFENPFETTPAVVCTFNESLGSGKRGFVSATSITASGYVITIDSDSALSDVDVGWTATEKRSRDRS